MQGPQIPDEEDEEDYDEEGGEDDEDEDDDDDDDDDDDGGGGVGGTCTPDSTCCWSGVCSGTYELQCHAALWLVCVPPVHASS